MFNLNIKGKFRDTLRYKSINGFDRIEKRDWKTNQIQDSSSLMIATFLAGGHIIPFSAFTPINFIALGTGASDWDDDPSNIIKPYNNTTLVDEASITNSRISVAPNDFSYLDTNGGVLNPVNPSNKIKLVVTIPLTSGLGNLREFGLFGGDATINKDSGIMLNWIDHPLIVKDNHLIIDREIILTFSLHRG